MQLADIGTNNIRGDELNPRLGYAIVRLDYLHNSCQRGVVGRARNSLWPPGEGGKQRQEVEASGWGRHPGGRAIHTRVSWRGEIRCNRRAKRYRRVQDGVAIGVRSGGVNQEIQKNLKRV